MGLLHGKKALIVGVASNRSIAYGIAKSLHREGAELAFTYQNEKLKSRVENIANEFNSNLIMPLDVNDDEQIKSLFDQLNSSWSGLDTLIHSVAFAPADQLEGEYLNSVTREGFKIAHEISSYSLAALAKAARSMLETSKGNIITLTYLGSTRVLPNYNVMGLAKASLEANVRYLANDLGPNGVRVNAISAGPIRTLAASGIKGLRKMLDMNAQISPLRKNITIEEVGNTAAFLASDFASGITGEILHVDAGFHAMAMPMLELES